MAAQPYSGAPTSDLGVPDLHWGTWSGGMLGEWWERAPELIWPESIPTFGRMRHDPQLSGVLKAYILPLLRASWYIDPAGCRDEVVQLCSEDLDLPILGDKNGDEPGPARTKGVIWKRHLREAVKSSLEFGYMAFERRYRIDGDQLRLDHLGPRMPWTIARMALNADATMNHIVQTTGDKPIPANRLVWYVNGQEGANWAGFSVLRPAYGAWLMKHECWRVLATSIRRFGMGVPTVEAPAGATENQVQQARALASAMRVGETAGVGMPNGFKFSLSGLQGSVPDALGFIKYLDQQMSKMALAGLIDLGQTETGSRALGETFLDLFLLSLQAVADDVATVATTGWEGMPGILSDLVQWNWGEDEACPKVVCTDVGENYEVTAEAIGKLVQFGALDPDPNLDTWIRKAWRLPDRADVPADLPAPKKSPAPMPVPAQEGQQPGAPVPGQANASRRGRHAVASTAFRRKLSTVEAAAGFDPAQVRQDWQDARDALVASYKTQVLGMVQHELAEQVEASVQGGKLASLAGLTVDVGSATTLIEGAMVAMARTAANRARAEAKSQGVLIPAVGVTVDDGKLGQVAAARATMLGTYLGQQASQKALQIAAAAPLAFPPTKLPGTVAQTVLDFLEGLSDVSLFDQLGAALTAAQNAGRTAVFAAAPESAGTAEYVATEIEDDNTCENCRQVDQTVFGSLTDAEAAYPTGGYIDCLGMLRCRGTVIAYWGGLTP